MGKCYTSASLAMPVAMLQSRSLLDPHRAGQLAFARMVARWRQQQGWTWKRLTAVSALADGSGSGSVSNTYQATLTSIVKGKKDDWAPHPRMFDGFETVSVYLDQVNKGEVQPQLPYYCLNGEVVTEADVIGKKGLVDEDGTVLSSTELFRIFTGKRLPPLCQNISLETMEAIAPAFGRGLEQIMVQEGLAPIRDLNRLLKNYPDDHEKLRRVLMDEDSFTAAELDEVLPFIAYALQEISGSAWTPETLAAAVEGIITSSSNRRPLTKTTTLATS